MKKGADGVDFSEISKKKLEGIEIECFENKIIFIFPLKIIIIINENRIY